jgi:hypothetical protein
MRMRATKRISNFQNWAARQIREVKKAAQEAMRSLIGKGGCPCLLQGGSDTRGIVKPTVDKKTPSTHCQSSTAAIEQLETNITTLTHLVHTLRTKPSPPHSEANSNDLYCDDIPEPRNTDTADNVTPPTASSSTDAEQTGPTDTVEVPSSLSTPDFQRPLDHHHRSHHAADIAFHPYHVATPLHYSFSRRWRSS